MAASSNALNPINPAGTAQTLLGKFAASDAKHDFATSFLNIFRGQTYSNIGTTGTAPDELFDEWGTLYKVFSSNVGSAANTIFAGDESDPGANFKRNVLNTNADSVFTGAGLPNIPLNTALHARHTYKLRSKLFSTGSTVNLSNSDALIQFLGGDNKDIYIQQDASFISFSDFFISDKNPSEGEVGRKHFYYLGSREGQNDAAGKTNSDSAVVKKTGDKKVAVSILNDTSNKTIIYPKYTTDQNSEVNQNFQSIYNLSISPIQTVKGVQMVSLNFYDKDQINATQKGKAENAKGNLKERLTNFFKNFSTIRQNNQSYFTALQQKRSGDWLQVLSTYDLARYNITGRRGILITHDLICAAYAIAMGVDVVITIQYNSGAAMQKWLVFFQNELYLTPPTKNVLFERYTHIKGNINVISIQNDIGAYKKDRATEIPKFAGEIDKVKLPEFNSKEATQDFQDKANGYIKKLLEVYFHYTIALTIFPEANIFQSKYDSLISKKTILEPKLGAWEGAMANITDEDRRLFSEYEKVISDIYNIQKALDEFKNPSGGILLINLAKMIKLRFSTKSKDIQELNTFLDSFSPFSVEDPTKANTSRTFLNRFHIKNNITNTKKKNDYGVFAMYLNKLDDAKKSEIYNKILACKTSFITAVAGITDDRRKKKTEGLGNNFELFIDEIKLYFKDATAPSFQAGTTGELLNEINDIQAPVPDPLPDPPTNLLLADVEAMARERLADEGKNLPKYTGINGVSGGAKKTAAATARAAAEDEVPQDTSSIVSSTPFSIYLIWLLRKRKDYIISQRYSLVTTGVIGATTIASGVGGYFLTSFISSYLSSYIPPFVADPLVVLLFGGIGAGAGSSTLTFLRTNLERLEEVPSYKLTTNAYETLSNATYIQIMRNIEETRQRNERATAATARGLAGGGPLDSFDLPYSNWATLFYHMDTMRTQLDDINNPEHGFDYSYFARYSQFLIAMEKSIDSTIRFFTIKSPKKGGQYGSTTVVLTDEPKVKSKPTQLVLRLKGGPLDLYEVPIGYCALFTSFGDYSDLILSNLLPRVYFDSVWDELKLMLTKAFTGSEEPDAKWIGLVAETCNDNYLNTSADTNLNELLDPKDLFLRYFLITTCYNLEQMPILDMSIAGKESLERELNESIKRLVSKINLVEKNIIVHMYKKKVNDDSINFETINDVGFLMEKNLLLKLSEPESKATEGGRRKRQLKKRTYGKTKKNGRKMRLKSRRKS